MPSQQFLNSPSSCASVMFFFGLTALLICPKAGSTFWLMFLSQCLVCWFLFLNLCAFIIVSEGVITFCLSFFPIELQFFTPCNMFLDFPTCQTLMPFFNLTILLCLSFLKNYCVSLFYQCLMNISWLVWGGSVLLKSCLPSVPTIACFGSCCRAILVRVNFIPSEWKQVGSDVSAVHQTCTTH